MDDGSLDIALQETDDIGARIVLLSAIGFWPTFTEYRDRQTWLHWLEGHGILDIATDAERSLITRQHRTELTEAEQDRSRRSFDAIWPLAWAVGLHDQPGFALDEETLQALIEELPTPGDAVEPFLDGILIRLEDDIAVERERAEVWNWRLAAEVMMRSGTKAIRTEMQEAVQEVVLECATSPAFPDVDGLDFLVGEVQVRNLETLYLEVLMVASDEQLRALNWLCGLTEWESIHFDE